MCVFWNGEISVVMMMNLVFISNLVILVVCWIFLWWLVLLNLRFWFSFLCRWLVFSRYVWSLCVLSCFFSRFVSVDLFVLEILVSYIMKVWCCFRWGCVDLWFVIMVDGWFLEFWIIFDWRCGCCVVVLCEFC